jgi:hypothetical protein
MIFDRLGSGLLAVGLAGIVYMAASHTRSVPRAVPPICISPPGRDEIAPVQTRSVARCRSNFSVESTISPAIEMTRAPSQPIGRTWDRGVHPMRGPFESLDAAFGVAVSDYETMRGSPPFEELTVLDVVGAKQPSLIALLEPRHVRQGAPMHTLHLVAKVAGKWYVEDLGATGSDHDFQYHMGPRWFTTDVDAPVVADVLGSGGSEILVHSTTSRGYTMNAMKDVEDRQLICGVGPSGVPSCASIEIGARTNDIVDNVHLHLSVACDGFATIVGSLAGKFVREQFRIVFP